MYYLQNNELLCTATSLHLLLWVLWETGIRLCYEIICPTVRLTLCRFLLDWWQFNPSLGQSIILKCYLVSLSPTPSPPSNPAANLLALPSRVIQIQPFLITCIIPSWSVSPFSWRELVQEPLPGLPVILCLQSVLKHQPDDLLKNALALSLFCSNM